jgi:hypothetical protein
MIEISHTIKDAEKIARWLERAIRPELTPDVSNYAKGRLRAWLKYEPTLTRDVRVLPGIPVEERFWKALQDRIGWEFDFALVTYSGDGREGQGILPHRDASYADYEAYSLHLTGECRFDYWQGRDSFGAGPSRVQHNPAVDAPTESKLLAPGQVVRFNCKNVHAAVPGPGRWNINFWKGKRR